MKIDDFGCIFQGKTDHISETMRDTA